MYYDGLNSLSRQGKINLPVIPGYASHNAHMFYIKTKDLEERTHLIKELGNEGISAVSHYVPLHSSPYGLNNCRFDGEDVYTTKESERLLRLPLYYGLEESDTAKVINAVNRFFR
jgi:dTDP-4-amino-4,6-dideoxygalactose transaminase